jgi:hypothetical protein
MPKRNSRRRGIGWTCIAGGENEKYTEPCPE